MPKALFYISLTILVTVVVDFVLRLLIKVPKTFDTRRSRTFVTILRNIVTIILYAIAIYIIFVELGINITPLLASAGIVGVIIGLGAKTLIEDLIAGLFLLSQDSIAVGDYVDINDAEGYIEKINFRTLVIRSGTGAIYIVPSGQIKSVTNFSRHTTKYPVDIILKANQPIDSVLKAMENALADLQKDKDLAEILLPGAKIGGIEEFKTEGHMLVKAVLVCHFENRILLARKFRYLVKKEFEKHKLHFS